VSLTFGSLFAGKKELIMPSGGRPKQYPPDQVSRVREMYEFGMTQEEIAAATGTTQKVIWNLMRRHSIKARVAAKRNQWGERNHSWRGDRASYKAFHQRLYKKYGNPQRCDECGKTSPGHYDWANISGRFEDMADYKRLCRSCHWRLDGKINNIRHMNGGDSKCQGK